MKKDDSILFKIFIVILIVMAFSLYIYSKCEENILKNEFNELMNKDLATGNFNTKIKTVGKYSIVEKSIKSYLSDYSKNLKELSKYANDDNLKTILSASNLGEDGKTFSKSKAYIESYRVGFNTNLNNLKKLSTNKGINEYIKNKKLNSYFTKQYNDLMKSREMKEKISKGKKYYESTEKNIISLIDSYESVLNFLSMSNSWRVSNNKIVFTSTDDLNTYNSLISKIK